MKKIYLFLFLSIITLTACNKDWEFADYKYKTVYFAYQSPVRTLVLGEDIIDNSMDNQHKFSIMATMGGVYENKQDVTLDVALDDALTQRVKFNSASGDNVIAMPSNYYSVNKEMKILIPSGKVMGGLEVQLTDAFFADPRSIRNTFVIPVRIKSVQNADSILRGSSTKTSPDPRQPGDWGVAPKDYVLYAVKYVNPYHGVYLRRGTDEVKGSAGNAALDTNVVYRNAFVEKDEVCNLSTLSLNQDTILLNAKNKGNINVPFRLVLNFDAGGKCTITGPSSASYTVSGQGEFVKKGDMWGNEKRDVLRLKYQVNFGTTVHTVTDTLVMRNRGVNFETFTPVIY